MKEKNYLKLVKLLNWEKLLKVGQRLGHALVVTLVSNASVLVETNFLD